MSSFSLDKASQVAHYKSLPPTWWHAIWGCHGTAAGLDYDGLSISLFWAGLGTNPTCGL